MIRVFFFIGEIKLRPISFSFGINITHLEICSASINYDNNIPIIKIFQNYSPYSLILCRDKNNYVEQIREAEGLVIEKIRKYDCYMGTDDE